MEEATPMYNMPHVQGVTKTTMILVTNTVLTLYVIVDMQMFKVVRMAVNFNVKM